MLKLVLVIGVALYTLWVYHAGYDAGQAEKVRQQNATIQTITTEHLAALEQVSDLTASNAALTERLRIAEQTARRAPNCPKCPAISSDAAKALTPIARDCDNVAQYARTCYQWIISQYGAR